ncbi:MAG TPA: hypothetical protein PK728_09680 [Bacillota bacterium]|nr:hypothetical protein [Bacillota bacterium]
MNMSGQNRIFEGDYKYGNRVATLFKFENGMRIIGFKNGQDFDLRVLTIGGNPRRAGFGREALRQLRPRFRHITVSEIYEESLPFWEKMKESGLVDELRNIKWEIRCEDVV